MDEQKIVSLRDAQAKAAGVSPELIEVIDQLNQRFEIRLDIQDERLSRFKMLYTALNEAAMQTHDFNVESDQPEVAQAFKQGVDIGKAQMMTDVIVCILEQDGLIARTKKNPT